MNSHIPWYTGANIIIVLSLTNAIAAANVGHAWMRLAVIGDRAIHAFAIVASLFFQHTCSYKF